MWDDDVVQLLLVVCFVDQCVFQCVLVYCLQCGIEYYEGEGCYVLDMVEYYQDFDGLGLSEQCYVLLQLLFDQGCQDFVVDEELVD